MDYSGQLGGCGANCYGLFDGGWGVGRNPAFSSWQGRGPRAGYSMRGNPLWSAPMDHDQAHSFAYPRERNHRDAAPGLDREYWEQSNANKVALKKIAEITSESWQEQEYVECQWDFAEAALEVQKLQSHAMLCYFTKRAHFDVRLETYTQLPVWIEIPFRSLLLENCRQQVAGALGKVLYYVQGDDFNTFPHDRACILWDTTCPIPKSIKINLKDGLAIWQPITFRNIPYHCYKCNRRGHLAHDCTGDCLTTSEPPPTSVPAELHPGQESSPHLREDGPNFDLAATTELPVQHDPVNPSDAAEDAVSRVSLIP
ncbi:unnamed protein product [Calypogeia fissa]